ncbi:MAG: PQQ-like beta-propeller repeat protein [Thermoanaerobaculia bacterium]|nr:PQQ-like beta-propeller repeat protein [Thermoanaerobaculia bacterium]
MPRPYSIRPRSSRPFWFLVVLSLLAGASALAAQSPSEEAGADSAKMAWPQFRGPEGLGHAAGPAPPAEFDVESGKNVLWRTAVPGLAHSSPVVWGDLVFVTTAVTVGDKPQSLKAGMYGDIGGPGDQDQVFRWQVLAYDRHTGELAWLRTAAASLPATGRHTKSTHADPTPAVDGERVVVSFGSKGFFAYAHDGQLLWEKNFGVLDGAFFRVPSAQWGYGTSPILVDGRVVVQADVVGESFLAVLDADTGKEVWRTKRQDVPTWSTPAVADLGDRRQILANGHKHLGGYDFETGEALWWMTSLSDIPVPTPQVAEGADGPVAYFGGAHGGGAPIYAVDLDARGDLDQKEPREAHLLWSHDRFSSYLPSHLIHGDQLLVLRDGGILVSFDRHSGEKQSETRIRSGAHTASPIAAGQQIYLAAESGEVTVLGGTGELEQVGIGQVDDVVHATPAISNGILFVRGAKYLTALGASPESTD